MGINLFEVQYEDYNTSDFDILVRGLVKKGYHEVFVDRTTVKNRDYREMDEWGKENLKDEFLLSGWGCYFKDREDMVKFVLTWL